MYRHILFPTDGSECAQHALPAVEALAKAYGSRVTVLHAVQLPLNAGTPTMLGLSPGQLFNMQDLQSLFEERGHTLLAETLKPLKQAGILAEGLLSHEGPREAILETLTQQGCDLLVMGTRHHSALQRALVGSISTYLSHHVSIPLLLIPAAA